MKRSRITSALAVFGLAFVLTVGGSVAASTVAAPRPAASITDDGGARTLGVIWA